MKWEIESVRLTEHGLEVAFVRYEGDGSIERVRGVFTKWVTERNSTMGSALGYFAPPGEAQP